MIKKIKGNPWDFY